MKPSPRTPQGRECWTGAEAEAAAASRPESCPVPPVLRRFGAAAFLFFLVKGLLWLAIPAGIALWRGWSE